MWALTLLLALGAWAQNSGIAALAKIGDQVITTRDLQINQFLNEFENPLLSFKDKKDPLREMTWEYLIYKESLSVLNQSASENEKQIYLREFQKKVQNDKLWRSLQVDSRTLLQHIERKIIVKKLVQLKMPEDLVEVDSDSIESYYALNRNQLGQKPLSEVREKIVKALKQQKLQERFKDWIAAITRNHGVVYFSGVQIQ